MDFECYLKRGKKVEKWKASTSLVKDYGNVFDVFIISRSSIRIIVGYSTWGNFLCTPDFNVGCHIADFKDIFWNTEKLSRLLGKVDGITVATVIHGLADILDRNYKDDTF